MAADADTALPSPGVSVEISVECAGWAVLPDAAELCRDAAQAALAYVGANRGPAELSIVLTDDATVQDLNRRYRDNNRPTNVLSFPGQDHGIPACTAGDGPPVLLGDVVLAAGTVVAEARVQGKSLSDHLRHLVVHGVLHLVGYDHESDEEAEEMEAVEKTVLAGLGVKDPYSAGAAAPDR